MKSCLLYKLILPQNICQAGKYENQNYKPMKSSHCILITSDTFHAVMPYEFFINISLCSPAGHVDQLILISFSQEAVCSPSHHFSLLQLPTVSNYSLDLNEGNTQKVEEPMCF